MQRTGPQLKSNSSHIWPWTQQLGLHADGGGEVRGALLPRGEKSTSVEGC
jgi:hypothetical protein